MTRLEDACRGIDAFGGLDGEAMDAARRRLDSLTKPPGSLGRLEDLAVQLAGITGRPQPTFDRRTIVVAAADHGVAARGVSAYPQAVTRQMVDNFLGGGAAVSVLARLAHADLIVVDAGVATPAAPGDTAVRMAGRLVAEPIRRGTADMTAGPAMTCSDAEAAIDLGVRVATELAASTDIVAVGEMGIGNTTAASAIVAALTRRAAADVTGRGTGVDDEGWRRKVAAVERAIAVNGPDPSDPVGVVAAVGGLEIATLAGVILGCAAARIPVVLDGFITGAAALIAVAIAPHVAARVVAAHRSPEPGHAVVLERLRLEPLLDLGLRLGEGTGAALALSLVDAACAVRDGMATFESAGVSGRSAT